MYLYDMNETKRFFPPFCSVYVLYVINTKWLLLPLTLYIVAVLLLLFFHVHVVVMLCVCMFVMFFIQSVMVRYPSFFFLFYSKIKLYILYSVCVYDSGSDSDNCNIIFESFSHATNALRIYTRICIFMIAAIDARMTFIY